MAHPVRWFRGLLLTAAVVAMVSEVPAADTAVVAEETAATEIVRCRISDQFEIYNPHSTEHLKAIREMGFHQVILDWPNLHAEATQMGLDVVIANWWTAETEISEIEKRIEFLGEVNPRHLAAISMMDEPERNSPDTPFSYYQALYQDLRKHLDQELPAVKLEISHWGPLRAWTAEHYRAFVPLYQGTDRIRLMPYPDLSEGPLNEVFLQMQRSRRVMQLAGREIPQIVILQTWVLPEKPTLPTIGELRVMAWQAILTGAETVSFFSYEPDLWSRTPGFTEGFRELMRELTSFTRSHRNSAVVTELKESGILTSQVTTADGRTITIEVNTNREAVSDLAGLAVRTSWPVTSPAALAHSPADRCVQDNTAGCCCGCTDASQRTWCRARCRRRSPACPSQ